MFLSPLWLGEGYFLLIVYWFVLNLVGGDLVVGDLVEEGSVFTVNITIEVIISWSSLLWIVFELAKQKVRSTYVYW